MGEGLGGLVGLMLIEGLGDQVGLFEGLAVVGAGSEASPRQLFGFVSHPKLASQHSARVSKMK